MLRDINGESVGLIAAAHRVTAVEPGLVVINVADGDRHFSRDVGPEPMDVWICLSGLECTCLKW